MQKKRVNLLISVVVGFGIFGFFLYKSGIQSVMMIVRNLNIIYLFIFITISLFLTVLTTYRWKIILNTYAKGLPFFTLFKQTLACYAVSYVTPISRFGGEPVKAYMLNKECNIDLKTGSATIIMDRFVELTGAGIFGLAGLFILMFMPNFPLYLKISLATVIILGFFFLFIFYYRTLTGKGSFTLIINFLRLYKIVKIKSFIHALEDVEKKMSWFFINHKKAFVLSFLVYFVYGILVIVEMKVLLLSLGVNASLGILILVAVVHGIATFVPVPAGVGFLEAGQTGLFYLLENQGSIGFALSLLIRIRDLILVAFGFALISYFGGRQIEKIIEKAE